MCSAIDFGLSDKVVGSQEVSKFIRGLLGLPILSPRRFGLVLRPLTSRTVRVLRPVGHQVIKR